MIIYSNDHCFDESTTLFFLEMLFSATYLSLVSILMNAVFRIKSNELHIASIYKQKLYFFILEMLFVIIGHLRLYRNVRIVKFIK